MDLSVRALLVGLLGGLGLFSIWWSTWTPRPAKPPEAGQPPWTTRVEDTLRQAGVPRMHASGLIGTCGASGFVAAAGVFLATGSATLACCFGLIASAAPAYFVRARARSRRIAVRELWPEAIDHLAGAVRAGLSLPEALTALAERGPAEMRADFAVFAAEYRATGRFVVALDVLKRHLADPTADRVVEALRLTREVGGTDLGSMLRTLSAFLREDARTRAELEARQSWTVNGAKLAVAAPWIVLAMLCTRPEAVAAYSSRGGALLLGTGLGVSFVAYRVMRRIGRLPDEPRVLR
ncbi:type II secretion system F family protein [Spelaeicoccus albus]|uniref:Tight adherence protein B n=1 Tax=Spelaeicoccus albus TaxID=1280376 RepID=A0A7Z0IJC0_9MICO|nr:type II secretion system F family protein [Spelaeicoccus albus]NYI69261.1 tight adherence protein B [Spelaeicoccus albus]